MTGQEPRIYEHDATILTDLVPELPHSISLLRRIQHGLAYPSQTAKILSTFPPGAPAPTTPWLAARVDLFRGRETQISLYSSIENSSTKLQPIEPLGPEDAAAGPSPSAAGQPTPAKNHLVAILDVPQSTKDLACAQLLALLAYVKTHLRPAYLSHLSSQPATPVTATQGVALIPAPDPNAFLIGSLHSDLLALLLASPVSSEGVSAESRQPIPCIKIHRTDNPPYEKIFFPRNVFGAGDVRPEIPLPPGYSYRDSRGRTGVLHEHLDLVQSRTHIPRSKAQLSTIPGVAVYADKDLDLDSGSQGSGEMPIAWCFLGVDGPLATLHVEPEHRGRGIALALAKEMMRRGMDDEGLFGARRSGIEDSEVAEKVGGWVHTEVAAYNKASKRVMEKIGGEVKSTVVWAVVELLDE